MKQHLLYLIGILLLFPSCKNHLSKKEAKRQIVELEGFPRAKEYQFTKSFTKDYNTSGNGLTVEIDNEEWEKKLKMIESFEKRKLISFTEVPQREESTAWLLGTTTRTWTEVNILLTEEGKKYLIQETDEKITVRLWDENISKINNVHEYKSGNKKYASVGYNMVKENITPFGEFFPDEGYVTVGGVLFTLRGNIWVMNRDGE